MSSALAIRHLALRLQGLQGALRAAVRRQGARAAGLARPDLLPMGITDEQVRQLLDEAETLLASDEAAAGKGALIDVADAAAETRLRAEAAALAVELPLDALARSAGLSPVEQQALLLCAAPEIDRAYERLYGFILDDLGRRCACAELIDLMDIAPLAERLRRRPLFGPHGALWRHGLLQRWGDAATGLRQEWRLAPGVLDCLSGLRSPQDFHDPAEVEIHGGTDPGPDPDQDAWELVGAGVRSGDVAIVGLWGPPRAGHDEAAAAIARSAGKPLRRLVGEPEDALAIAASLGALLLVDVDAMPEAARPALAASLARSAVPALLIGTAPWRPAALLAVRGYVERTLTPPDLDERRQLWTKAWPEADDAAASALAAGYRVGALQVRAAGRVARTAARTEGLPAPGAAQIAAACDAVFRPSMQRHVTVVEPKRGPEDLVLSPALHAQVLEVAAFQRAGPRVAEHWGFGRIATGALGIRALFSGDSGTGKTLAAEVIAKALGMPLLKVDLAQVVSKWVGETEQHLDAVFREAEDSHGVLFFDEADALFGKRGEVHHGVDRYANLEVSFLLQRIEAHAGLVILASNLKENIDPAFTRRFQVVLEFPRPEPAQRRRLWEIAFPPGAPVESGLDLVLLARLDLTGAGIAGAARTAALLAAAAGRSRIEARDVVRALARQYQREARVLMPAELGPYAAFAQEVP